MTTTEKKEAIRILVNEMLNESCDNMIKKVEKILNSNAIDIDSWSKDNAPMILPKCIVTAILKDESTQYEGKGTSFEKRIKNEVNNIRHFI